MIQNHIVSFSQILKEIFMKSKFKVLFLLILVGTFTVLFLSACNQAKTPISGTDNPESTEQPDTPALGNIHEDIVQLPFYSGPQLVTYEVINNEAIFQGDIILGKVDADGKLIQKSQNLTGQSITVEDFGSLWPNGTVPYEIASDVTNTGVNNINSAIVHWQQNTPINFIPKLSLHNDYIKFVRGDSQGACSSAIGRQGGEQEIKLNTNGSCSVGALIHEIGHAVGLWHEQSRPDRNANVTINWANIQSNRLSNFCRPGETVNASLGRCSGSINNDSHEEVGPYDFGSIMHYGAFAFCILNTSGNCIGSTINANGNTIGQRTALSDGDIAAVNRLYGFKTFKQLDWFCIRQEKCVVGDINGDRKDDLVTFLKETVSGSGVGDVYVAYSSGAGNSGFHNGQLLDGHFCYLAGMTCDVGDVDGDGKDDLISFYRETWASGAYHRDVWIKRSNGSSVGGWEKWHDHFCILSQDCHIGDINGDGRDDIIAFVKTNGEVWVAYSNGSSFGPATKISTGSSFCYRTNMTCDIGDVDGDGKDDFISYYHDTFSTYLNDVWVKRSQGTSMGGWEKWADFVCRRGSVCHLADVNDDGADDLIEFVRESRSGTARGDVYIGFSDPARSYFRPPFKMHDWFCINQEICQVGDFNGDGRADLVTFLRDTASGSGRGDVYEAVNWLDEDVDPDLMETF